MGKQYSKCQHKNNELKKSKLEAKGKPEGNIEKTIKGIGDHI